MTSGASSVSKKMTVKRCLTATHKLFGAAVVALIVLLLTVEQSVRWYGGLGEALYERFVDMAG